MIRRAGLSAKGQLRWVVAAFLLLTTGIVVYNAVATNRERSLTLRVNVAARQSSAAEAFITDILLQSHGVQADSGSDARDLLHTANALLNGGEVAAVQGADRIIRIGAASEDWRVRAKLVQERKLIGQLVAAGEEVLQTHRSDARYGDRLLRLRIIGAQLSSLTNDIVGQMTVDAQSSLSRLVRVGVVLGALGALSALVMAFLLRRLNDQQTARFRSLVQNSSDVITVIDPQSTVAYQSPASEKVLGRPSESLVGTRLDALVHPDDGLPFARFVEDLGLARDGAVVETEVRLRRADGAWREMHFIGSNLLADRTVGGFVLTARDVTERRQAERELAAVQVERTKLLDRTVEATEQERRRLAADLHDGPVQHLSAMEIRLQVLRDRLGEGAGGSAIDRVQDSLRNQVQALRSMMTELRPPALDERGLGAALRDHLASVERQSGLRCTVESTITGRLEPTYETLLYRVAQESLTNAVKHARASNVWVRLREDDGVVELEIADNGLGFDLGRVAQADGGRHLGLVGMRERVEMAGGTWRIDTMPGAGTRITARLPIRTAGAGASNGNGAVQTGSIPDRSAPIPAEVALRGAR